MILDPTKSFNQYPCIYSTIPEYITCIPPNKAKLLFATTHQLHSPAPCCPGPINPNQPVSQPPCNDPVACLGPLISLHVFLHVLREGHRAA